jgi:hypothetical protein
VRKGGQIRPVSEAIDDCGGGGGTLPSPFDLFLEGCLARPRLREDPNHPPLLAPFLVQLFPPLTQQPLLLLDLPLEAVRLVDEALLDLGEVGFERRDVLVRGGELGAGRFEGGFARGEEAFQAWDLGVDRLVEPVREYFDVSPIPHNWDQEPWQNKEQD